jgi:hypothetical protein
MQALTVQRLGEEVVIEVNEEKRPKGNPPWGSLIVNGHHVWRFDTAFDAQTIAHQLYRALERDPVKLVAFEKNK